MPCAHFRRIPISGAARSAIAAVVVAVLLALTIAPAESQPSRNADLDRIRADIARLKKRLDDVRQQTKSAEQELEEVDLELGIRTRELQIAEEMQGRLEDEQRSIQAQIAQLSTRIEQQRRYLKKRLVVLYRFGSLSYIRMFLAIDQRRDPIEAMSMLSYLVSRDARAVSRYQTTRDTLTLRNADLADRARRLAQMHAVVEERQRAVAQAHDEKERLLASLHSEETQSGKQLADLEEKARRLERLIGVLSRQKQADAGTARDIRSLQGALAWPVQGKVVEHFGRQRNPKFATVTTNNGLKIAAAAGAPVRAVFGGTVLFSQWFKGYGNLVIVDHGNRIVSLYGNLKSPAVAANDRVTAGQAIAGVGEAEDQQSGYLYFEIRQDNKPQDPQKWLR